MRGGTGKARLGLGVKTSEGRAARTSTWIRVGRGFERREQGRLCGKRVVSSLSMETWREAWGIGSLLLLESS